MKISYHANSNTAEYAKTLEQTAPEGCDLKVGDVVTFVNDYGVVFPGKEVIGFYTQPDSNLLKYGNFIHIDTDAYWFPHKPSELIKESLEEGEARRKAAEAEWLKKNKK
ncbi:hypothetical protein D3C71_1864980 [compost metagenome]